MIFYRWTLNRAVTLDLDSWDGNLGDWKGIGVDFYSYAYLSIARRRKREEKTRIFKDALLNDRVIIAECTLRDWILLKGVLIDGKLYNSRNFTGVINASVQFTMVQKSLDEIPIRFHLEPRSIIHLPRFINTKCVFDFPLFLINQFRAFLIWQIDTRNDKIR